MEEITEELVQRVAARQRLEDRNMSSPEIDEHPQNLLVSP
jgi:hypothetical protein